MTQRRRVLAGALVGALALLSAAAVQVDARRSARPSQPQASDVR